MDNHTATEQAFRNGYAEGFADAKKRFAPCKIGDIAWGIRIQAGNAHLKYGRISHIEYTDSMELKVTLKNACRGIWGKTIFDTKEKALAALYNMGRRVG